MSFVNYTYEGGWSETDKTNAAVLAAANFVMNKEFTASEINFVITYAAQQVVAGMNYDLTIDVTSSPDNTCETHEYKIYRSLRQEYSLSSANNLGACS